MKEAVSLGFTEREQKEIDKEVQKRLLRIRKNAAFLIRKNSSELLNALILEFRDETMFFYNHKNNLSPIYLSPNLTPEMSIKLSPVGKFIDKGIKKGIFKVSMDKELSGKLREILEGKCEIHDEQNYRMYPDRCLYCGTPFFNEPGSARTKYCSHRCKLSAYYERRDKAKGRMKTIEINQKCLICGKSIEGKRAGAKTCSLSCRKTLSLQNRK